MAYHCSRFRRGTNRQGLTERCLVFADKGVAPWEIEYSVVGQRTKTISGITKSPHAFDIEIPSSIAKHGGQFALSLGTSGPPPGRVKQRF